MITRHNIKMGMTVIYIVDEFGAPKKAYRGTVVVIESDHFLLDIPEISDHVYGFYNDPLYLL